LGIHRHFPENLADEVFRRGRQPLNIRNAIGQRSLRIPFKVTVRQGAFELDARGANASFLGSRIATVRFGHRQLLPNNDDQAAKIWES